MCIRDRPGGEDPDDPQNPGGSEDQTGGNGSGAGENSGSQTDTEKHAPKTGD